MIYAELLRNLWITTHDLLNKGHLSEDDRFQCRVVTILQNHESLIADVKEESADSWIGQ